ncbi:MAG TPA: (Fe-S)-binding protein [Anaerolineae bacterium]|nr:(Fe-S)-binding protein [Anaerolineae bacterium]
MRLADAEETIRACRFCFMCRYACPTFVATKRESVTPRGYGLLLTAIGGGKQAWTEDIARAFYQCTLCGLCRERCEYHWAEDDMVLAARGEAVCQGHVPEAVRVAAASLLDEKPWAGGAALPRCGPHAEVLYLAGCQARERHPEIVEATARALSSLGVQWGVLAEEGCCGGGLYDLGFAAEAALQAQRLASQISEVGPAAVVTGCPHCYRCLKELFPAWGVALPPGIRVLHTAEFLGEMHAAGRLRLDGREEEGCVGYHDPCMLGRKMGVYDAPRALIRAVTGSAPQELVHSGALAECCGAGAATFLVEPDVARRVAAVRLERAREAGVTTLVTACQNCRAALQEAAAGALQVVDLAELVARHCAR